MIENQEIFSSTGNLGVSRRQYERLYVNGTEYLDDVDIFNRNYTRLTSIGNRFEQKIGRSVFRGVVGPEIMNAIGESQFLHNLEVALPLAEYGERDSWLVYLAQNRPDRKYIEPLEKMIMNTDYERGSCRSVKDCIDRVVEQGYQVIDRFEEDQIDDIFNLWGPTFGWNRQEVSNLKNRLANVDSANPDVWFAGASHNGRIISCAMAERLSIPSRNGSLELVESTEWRTHEDYFGNGLMSGVVAALNANIVSDLRDLENPPLIYAECNFQSRSDRVGNAAGFAVPGRNTDGYYAPQILEQNVLVNDGCEIPEGKYRDFTFMHLPVTTIQSEYIPYIGNTIDRMEV